LINNLRFFEIPIIQNFTVNSFSDVWVNESPSIINCITSYSFYCFSKNLKYRKAILYSYNIPDGMSICWISHIIGFGSLKRFTAFDLLITILKDCVNLNYNRVSFIGSSPKVLSKIRSRILIEYSCIECLCISPPFQNDFTKDDAKPIINKISQFDPHVIFVGLSAPKQEIFTQAHLVGLKGVSLICNIGAAFEFFAGTEIRAPKSLQAIGLEGLFRTLQNPRKHLLKDIRSFYHLFYRVINHYKSHP